MGEQGTVGKPCREGLMSCLLGGSSRKAPREAAVPEQGLKPVGRISTSKIARKIFQVKDPASIQYKNEGESNPCILYLSLYCCLQQGIISSNEISCGIPL